MTAYPIPDAALAHHTILLGKTRAGKSSTMRGIVERLLDQGKPVGVIDPKGDWWGLKSSADGKRAGYPVIIFGGEHADVPINAHSGAQVAELVATGNRPFIIDFGGWMVGERTRFFVDFASSFFRHTRGPRHLVIDEVHNFAPQGRVLDPDSGKMLHWANRLASEGAGKGITLISASQRPQKVHKDYVTSHETLIAMRVIHPLDRGAVKEWVDGCPDPEKGKEVMTTLASLERGEGWVWSPEAKFGPVRIRFPLFKTYDSFAAPTSERSEKLKGWASVDLEDVRTKLATAVEEAKAHDPRHLKAEVLRLTRELAAAQKASPPPSWPDQREDVQRLAADNLALNDRVGELEGRLTSIANIATGDKLAEAFQEEPRPPRPNLPHSIDHRRQETGVSNRPSPSQPLRVRRGADRTVQLDGSVPSGCAKPLAVLSAMYPGGMTEAQWATAAGYKRTGGTWKEYRSRLKRAEMIEQRGDLYYATESGASSAGDVELPPSPGPELARWWAARISGTPRLVEQLIEAWPHTLTRDELAGQLDMTASGGSFKEYVSRLKRNGIAVEHGGGLMLAPEVMGS